MGLFTDYTPPKRKVIKISNPCEGCPLSGSKQVEPKDCSQPFNPIVFIGLYPGVAEDKSGKVFVGESGQYLHEVLRKVGFTEKEILNEVYETNMLRCKPGNVDSEDCAKHCGQYAEKAIEHLRPTLVVLLGDLPVKYFLNRKAVTPIRGQVKIKKDQKYFATFNPAHIIREPSSSKDRTHFEQDMRSVYEIWKGISADKEKDYKLINSIEELDAMLYYLHHAPVVSVDLETYAPGKHEEKKALDPYAKGFRVLSAAFSWEENKGRCVLIDHPDNKLDPEIVKAKLKAFLESEVPKIGQNFKFDWKVCAVHLNIFVNGFAFDTMLASSVLDPRHGIHNLDRLALDWLNERSYKYEMYRLGSEIPNVEDLVVRNCKDADIVLRLYPILKRELEKNDLYTYFMEQRVPAVAGLGRAEVRGLPVDVEYTKAMCKKYEGEIKILEDKIKSIPEVQSIPDFNIDSNDDLQVLLFDKFGMAAEKETKTGFSTDKATIKKLAKIYTDNEFLKLLPEYKDIVKFHGTYLEPLVLTHIKQDNRVHPTFNMHTAVTGRLSCTDPNVQNVPVRDERAHEIMDCYRAFPGWKIGLADYKNIELRILAQVSQDPVMLDAFRHSEDLHQRTADEMAKKIGRPLVPNLKQCRSYAKKINFGIVYGMTAYGLAENLGLYKYENGEEVLDTGLSQVYLDEYLNVYEGVKEYQKRQRMFLQQFGYVETLFGRKRWIKLTGKEKNDEEAYRRAVNTPIQGTASDINTMAFIKLVELYVKEGFKSFPISLIHDAIMFEMLEEESYLKDLNICVMENLPLPFLTSVGLEVDWTEGKTWGEAKGH